MPLSQAIKTQDSGRVKDSDGKRNGRGLRGGDRHAGRISTISSLNRRVTEQHHYYAGPAMRVVSSFNSNSNSTATAATRSISSGGSGSVDGTRPTSPNRRGNHVTFRDEKRVPRSVNASSLSKVCSTLSREEEGGNSGPCPGAGSGAVSGNRDVGSGSSSKSTPRETGPEEPVNNNNNLATSSMFTKDEIEQITPLQIATYLTLKERERIGTKVLCSKLKKGCSLIENGKKVCGTCSMPRLTAAGGSTQRASTEKCPVCPVLKRRVLRKILDGCRGGG